MDIVSVNLDTFHDELDQAVELYCAGRFADADALMAVYFAKIQEFIDAAERLATEQSAPK
ncbi:hypothetical protein [Urbifossiella limnaea]|uniref:hypothetical protein n=1 Tax=Urbifossiella limnaea TaxID=2528023 RepID=UPI0011A75EA5|nr:hypothetical protein [Urbifossiella limnaea]